MARAPMERVRSLVHELGRLGVDSELLGQISAILPENYGDVRHWAELAAVLRQRGNYGAAELVYKTALTIFERSALLWNNYGILLRDWDKLSQALESFDRAIELDSSYAKPLENKGRIFELLHRYAEARSCYQASLHLDPRNPRVANNIGVCLLGEGEQDQAAAWFEKALRLAPDFGDALFNLAALRLESGDLDAARRLVDKLSRVLPDDPEVLGLQARLRDADSGPRKIELPPARSLESGNLKPAVLELGHQLAGNPRSIFISYAWTNPSTKRFAARLCRDLQSHSFQVILDQNYDLEVHEILYLLAKCQNVVALNDKPYVESCLLGKVPVAEPSSPYPSFAFPFAKAQSAEYMSEVFKISAVVWGVARQLKDRGMKQAAELAMEVARPEGFEKVPGLRLFIEGWRVDEVQMVFSHTQDYRSISVLYLDGEDCLAGYPLFDFSAEEYYPTSFAALLQVLDLGGLLSVDDAPVEVGRPDPGNYRWRDSRLVSAKLWKIAEEQVMVWRPSITPSGEPAAAINPFREWEPL